MPKKHMTWDQEGRGNGQLNSSKGALLRTAARAEIVPAARQSIIPSTRGDLGSIAWPWQPRAGSKDGEIRQTGFIPDLIVCWQQPDASC